MLPILLCTIDAAFFASRAALVQCSLTLQFPGRCMRIWEGHVAFFFATCCKPLKVLRDSQCLFEVKRSRSATMLPNSEMFLFDVQFGRKYKGVVVGLVSQCRI